MSHCPKCQKDNGSLYDEGESCPQCAKIISLEIENKKLISELNDLTHKNKMLTFFGKHNKTETVTFNVECTMKARWVPQFLSMLKYMQQLGNLGGSRRVTLYSDGDGDFRPTFKFDQSFPCDVPPAEDVGGNRRYDAG